MEWHPAWRARRDAMIAHGLPARVIGVTLLPPWEGHRLLVLEMDIAEVLLPRTHVQRGFDLHLSLAFEEDLTVDLALVAMRLHRRWAGRHVVLRVAWLGNGGAAMLASNDPLVSDADIRYLHSRGGYSHRNLHVSL